MWFWDLQKWPGMTVPGVNPEHHWVWPEIKEPKSQTKKNGPTFELFVIVYNIDTYKDLSVSKVINFSLHVYDSFKRNLGNQKLEWENQWQ